MRWTLVVPVTNGARADGKVVWSWRLDAGARSVEATSQATETRKPISGESTKQPLTPSRAGMPGFPVDSWWLTRVLSTFCTRGCGCIGCPAFPAPLSGRMICRTRAKSRRGNAEACFAVIASEAKQSSFLCVRAV